MGKSKKLSIDLKEHKHLSIRFKVHGTGVSLPRLGRKHKLSPAVGQEGYPKHTSEGVKGINQARIERI